MDFVAWRASNQALPISLGCRVTIASTSALAASGGSRMEAKGGLNSGYVGLKLEINKNLRLINPNLMNK